MKSITSNVFKWCLLAYLAILPMADTIALRNLFLLVLLLLLLVWGMGVGRETLRGMKLLQWLPLPLFLWGVFLLLFPLWAVEPDVALVNLKGQWGASILAWIVGLGAVLMLGRRGPGVWALAGASAFLVGIHLLLTLMAWVGLFGPLQGSALSWSAIWQATMATVDPRSGAVWSWQSFPWGFRGFDPMHGNLGYTASQTIVLLIASFVLARQAHKLPRVWMAATGIILCFFSTVVANSRGAVLFSLLVLLLAVVAYLLRVRAGHGERSQESFGTKSHARWVLPLMGILLVIVFTQSLQKDSRWRSMLDNVRVGFMITDPVNFQCNGLTPEDEAAIRLRFADKPSSYADKLIENLIGDGGRIVLMRAGLQMVGEQPWGLDGSRQSYKKLMAARCSHTPVFEFAHAHQGWIDTSLALGWGGVLLWALLMVYLLVTGWRALGREAGAPWAWALFLLSAFWILRGFADSVYREHNLQMQALLLGYLWGRLKLETQQPF
ncbi:MAG: O-antigen ligase family protein [Hylemonella sp.]|nr:O-antigen ligase family protein [Hylemonella sp.]MDP1937991.1 O-antigen ligase family protein [Hylemonella sp.]